MYKKSILFLVIFTILFFITSFAKDSKKVQNKGKRVNYKLKTTINIDIVDNADKEHEKYAHPVELSNDEIARILYALRVSEPGYIPVQMFSIDEIKDIVEKGDLSAAFKLVTPNEVVRLIRNTDYLDNKGKVSRTKKDRLFFYFKKKDVLYVHYLFDGYKGFRRLVKGLDMGKAYRWDGTLWQNAIAINAKLWHEDMKKTIFPVDVDFSKLIAKQKDIDSNNSSFNPHEELQVQKTQLSLADLQKELERLNSMLEKKLITVDEYKKLKQGLLKKAGM